MTNLLINRSLLLTCFVVNQVGWIYIVREYRRAAKANAEQFNKLQKMAMYMAHMLEERGADLSEFDVIALRELGFIIEENHATE